MASVLNRARNAIRKTASPPKRFDQSHAPMLNSSETLEEEDLPGYSPHHYFPVKIADVYDERYQMLSKLGYGVTSTVWLCRDMV